MILRKPYAFLIKHFKAINLCVLLAMLFCLNRVLALYSFVKDYLQLGIYNVTLNSISNYINVYLYLALGITLLITGILVFLLRKKDKPYISYIYIILLVLISFILLIYVHNYFSYHALKEFNRQMTLLIRDLVLIDSLFYYPIIFVLIIRSLGIDLKNFGFYEDEAFITANEEDREEIEVDVAFNKERYLRMIKNKARYMKYFFLEHKMVLSLIGIIVLLIGGFNFYKYFYIENRIYREGETFSSNYYKIKINHTYLTDKDYTGNVISSNNRFFVIVDTDVTNLSSGRSFDASKLFLYVDDNYYVPTVQYNKSFADMGNTYSKDKIISYKETQNFILIYEIDKPDADSNFLLKYQELYTSKKMTHIRVKVLDISTFKQKGISTLGKKLNVPLNLSKGYDITIPQYEVTKDKKYTYESCYSYNCPIYEKVLTAKNGKKLLFFRWESDTDLQDFLSFLKKYGKVRYQIDNQEYIEKISLKITNYRGKYAYLEVNQNIENATNIELVFTVRTYQYVYRLKG